MKAFLKYQCENSSFIGDFTLELNQILCLNKKCGRLN